MNQLTIIGTLTRRPEARLKKMPDGAMPLCGFTVRVRGGNSGQASYFRVTCIGGLANWCMTALDKGDTVAVIGPVTARPYTGDGGQPRASLDVEAEKIERLGPEKSQTPRAAGEREQAEHTDIPF